MSADDQRKGHLSRLFEQLADAFGDDAALIQGERVTTWSGFDERSSRLAAAFLAAGLQPGDVVAIDLYNCPEYLEVFHGALKASLVPANVNYRYVDDELVDLLAGCGARALVYDAAMAEQVAAVRPRLPGITALLQVDRTGVAPVEAPAVAYEDALAAHDPHPRRTLGQGFYLSFTGGTTGLPKGVMFNLERSTRNGFVLRDSFLGRQPVGEEDPIAVARQLRAEGGLPVAVPASPLMHSTGFIFVSLPTLQAGGTVVLAESRSFDAPELWRVVERHRASLVGIVGDAFALPMQRAIDEAAAEGRRYDLSSLRVVCSAGVAWSAAAKRHLLRHAPGVRLVDACGSTEGATYGMRVATTEDEVATDNFEPMPGVLVLGEAGEPLPAGEVGILASPTPCDGYYLDGERTARAFRRIGGEQYTVPGDHGRFEADGSLTLIGRGTSTINTGGEKVHPEEVEHVLKAHDDVDDAIVLGIPDERFGSMVASVVSARPGAVVDVADLQAAVRVRLAAYKVPRRLVVVDRVPRSPNGKPDFAAAALLLTGATDQEP